MIQTLGDAIAQGNMDKIQSSFGQLQDQATDNLKIAEKVWSRMIHLGQESPDT